jgi:hypothetical protein
MGLPLLTVPPVDVVFDGKYVYAEFSVAFAVRVPVKPFAPTHTGPMTGPASDVYCATGAVASLGE